MGWLASFRSNTRSFLHSMGSRIKSGTASALRDEAGYTLIELIAAMIIFALVMIVTVGALVTVSDSSTKTGAERRVQQDARFNTEEITRQVRSASIDYGFYQSTNDANCDLQDAALAPNSTKALALFFAEAAEDDAADRKRMIFFLDGGAVYRYENSYDSGAPTCSDLRTAPLDADSLPRRVKLTADDVTVRDLTFFVSPNRNPYDRTPCGSGDAVCATSRQTHPRVTILMTVETGGGIGRRGGQATLQTTVNSRAYPFSRLFGEPGQ